MKRIACLWATVLAAAFAPAAAQTAIPITALPDTPAGVQTNDFLREYNTGELTDPRWARWYSIYGPVDSALVQQSSADRLRLWVRGRETQAWLGLDVAASERGESPEIIVFDMNGGLPDELRRPDAVLAPEALREQLTSYMDRLTALDRFSGAIAITRNGVPVFARGYGSTHGLHNQPIDTDTRFSIASVGKSFTAVAILQLVQAGRLALSDTLGKFLPDYPHASVRSATLKQLLTHSAGIGRASTDWIASPRQPSLAELVRLTVAEPDFAPGAQVRYSNEGYLLLGRVVEVVSGLDYPTYLARHVFEPAGMSRTGLLRWTDASDIAEPLSHRVLRDGGSEFVPGPRRSVRALNGERGTAAGGAISTANDLIRFVESITDGRLLDQKHFQLMSDERVQQPPPFPSFGLGVEVANPGGVLRIGKGGESWGVNANWRYYPDSGYTVVVMSNYDSIADVVATWIEERITP